MQRIKINERFSLCYDEMGDKWLVETKVSKNGKASEKNYCGYHWHFEYLLKAFALKKVDEKNAKTVKGALKALAEVEKETEELANQIGEKLDEAYNKMRDVR